MSDLTDFLLARIAEDEAVARRAIDGGSDQVSTFTDVWNGPGQMPAMKGRRLLAECVAKRLIVEFYQAVPDGMQEQYRAGLGRALRCLALPYADHPDHQSEWRV